ncbi:hypothetical protein EV426DRAFT_671821 [Tirmania nivea]|nr:hypothetical protein EV426DRAFT_671821 [Tirmania nivea]
MAEDPSKGENFFELMAIYATNAFKGYINRLTEGVDIKGTIIPSTATLIWHVNTEDKHIDNFRNGLGSTTPAIFRTPQKIDGVAPVVLLAMGRLPLSWKGCKYIVIAELDSIEVFRSEPQPVPEADEVVSPRPLIPLLISGLQLTHAPQLTTLCPIPFRLGGDFSWTIAVVDGKYSSTLNIKYGDPNMVDIIAARADMLQSAFSANTQTRLELYWVRSKAPVDSAEPQGGQRPHVNMPDGYPVSLLRMFAPSPTEFLGQPDKNHLLEFYIQRAMKVIWDPSRQRPKYETQNGASRFNMRMFGGDFALDDWVREIRTECNCMDLGGITQLACDLLQNDRGKELVDANYVCFATTGTTPKARLYINEGPLIGWTRPRDYMLDPKGNNLHSRCNNPLWNKRSNRTLPHLNEMSPMRTYFTVHVWVEVILGGSTVVLDNTHQLLADPSGNKGTRTRDEYLYLTYDKQNPSFPKAQPTSQVKVSQNGDGYIHVYPKTSIQRLGARGVTGQQDLTANFVLQYRDPSVDVPNIGLPTESTKHPGHSVIAPAPGAPETGNPPAMSFSSVEQLLRFAETHSGHSGTEATSRGGAPRASVASSRSMFLEEESLNPDTCTAGLSPDRLMSPELGLFPLRKTSSNDPRAKLDPEPKIIKRVFPTYTHQTIFCEYEGNAIETLAVDIYSFTNGDGATNRLARELMGYEELGALDSVTLSSGFGDKSFEVGNTIFWVFKNLFVMITESCPLGSLPDHLQKKLSQAAATLDSYLKSTGSPHGGPGPSAPRGVPGGRRSRDGFELEVRQPPVPQVDSKKSIVGSLPKMVPSEAPGQTIEDQLKNQLDDLVGNLNGLYGSRGQPLRAEASTARSSYPQGTRGAILLTSNSRSFASETPSRDGAGDSMDEYRASLVNNGDIYAGTVFTVQITNTGDEGLVDQMTAQSSDTDIVIPLNPAPAITRDDNPGFQFWAAKPGTAKLTIFFAPKTTLIPMHADIRVLVKEHPINMAVA